MPEPKEQCAFVSFSVFAVAFGLVILLFLLAHAGSYQDNLILNRFLVGSSYATVCILGILAAFYPNRCGRTFTFKRQPQPSIYGDQSSQLKPVRFRGHHPDCEKFSANRITIHKATFCSACGGLLIGALFALVGTVFYFFAGFTPVLASRMLLLVGYAGMFLGLAQFKLGGYVKLLANAFFVVGSLAVLTATDMLSSSLLLDLYALSLIVLSLWTRIIISDWNNRRTCGRCKSCQF